MWKQIQDFDYEINEQGEVRRISSQRVKKSFQRGDGYIHIQIWRGGNEKKMFQLHRLLALSFIPNPENKLFVNHINSIRSDNRIVNLEWCTHSENVLHSYMVGTSSNKGSNNGFSKLNEAHVLNIRKLYSQSYPTKLLTEIFQVHKNTIKSIVSRRSWSHI